MKYSKYSIITWLFLLTSACTMPTFTPADQLEGTAIPGQNLKSTSTEQAEMFGGQASATGSRRYYFPAVQNNRVSFVAQSGVPKWTNNFLHPEFGCNWMGVAGQIFDKNGKPVKGFVVEVDGILNGSAVMALDVSGTTPAIGPGGYEIKISDRVSGSSNSLYLRIFDPGGLESGDRFYFPTYGDCQKNLTIINFVTK